MIALALLLLAVCTLLPACYVTAALPALWLLQTSLLGHPSILITAGSVDFTLVDLLLLTLLAKFAFSIILTRQLAADRPLYFAIALYLTVNVLATAASGAQFGSAHMMRSFTALARFLSEIAIVPILAQTIQTPTQARRCARVVLATLVVLGLIQFINFFGASRGLVIGEVQGIERGELRYFGPVGDSIGFVLLLGYVAALCFGNVAGVLLFAGGIVLTAGIGAIFGAGVATIFFGILGTRGDTVRALVRQYLWLAPIAVFTALLLAATLARPMVQTLWDRLAGGKIQTSADQRVISTTLGVRMILDRPLSGVGFMGYSTALGAYGGRKFFDLAKPDGGRANANNQFIQTLTDAGLINLLAVATLLIAAARVLRGASAHCDDPLLRTLLLAAFIWLLALIFGNQAAVWIIPSSYVARLLWVMLGIAVAVRGCGAPAADRFCGALAAGPAARAPLEQSAAGAPQPPSSLRVASGGNFSFA